MNVQLLKAHFAAYPKMEPRDAVKLAYQSAYGCGHLLPGEQRCIDMIRHELESVPAHANEPPYTLLGNGLCRLHLTSPAVRELGAECIARLMKLTEQEVRSRHDQDLRYTQVINTAIALAHKGEAPFSYNDLRAYLDAYEEASVLGRQPVSHSETYRAAYHPAYRVVLADLAVLLPVIRHISEGRRLIVFDGPCGSGKSTLARLLAALFDTQPIPMDDFFLPPSMRTAQRLAEPGGNVHRERFEDEVLACLRQGGPVRWQRFDCQTGRMLPRELSEPASGIWVIEGSYSHHPAFRDVYREMNALRVFVTLDDAQQLQRIEKRDPELLSMFQSRWIPLEKNYFEAYDSKGEADVVLRSEAWDACSLFPA